MKIGVNQHKRMAMGQGGKSYARGGTVAAPVGAGPMVTHPTGRALSPLTVARHNNGVPGMCGGGPAKKKR